MLIRFRVQHRIFNPRIHTLGEEEAEREKCKKDAEEIGHRMNSLENSTLVSETGGYTASLDELMAMKSRHATVSIA